MSDRPVSVTEAARNFSDLVNRVFYTGESATLLRNGVPVARVVPPAPGHRSATALAQLWDRLPHLSPTEATRLAADIETARKKLPEVRSPWG